MTQAADGLTISTEDTVNGHVVKVAGELDLASAPQLSEALAEPGGDAEQPVVLDLSDVSFIDSSALRTLLLSGRQLADAGRQLQIGPRSDVVSRVLEVTQLDQQTEAFTVLPDPS